MVLELRQYTLKPRQRDLLVELFDREFVESQEVLGATIVGQFRDLDEPDRFVWLRSFPDMKTRLSALSAFYGGPVWRAHRDAANATMLDSDNVLLLRPVGSSGGFSLDGARRDGADSSGTIVGAVYSFDEPVVAEFIERFRTEIAPAIEKAGAEILATFVTESAENDFPALPVREGENVFVFFARLLSDAPYDEYLRALNGSAGAKAISQRLRLSPTRRSLLR